MSSPTTPALLRLPLAWSLRTFDESRLGRLAAEFPGAMNWWDDLADSSPVAQTCAVFRDGEYVRPMGHARSICRQCGDEGVMVVKGSQPYASDLEDAIVWAELRKQLRALAAVEGLPPALRELVESEGADELATPVKHIESELDDACES